MTNYLLRLERELDIFQTYKNSLSQKFNITNLAEDAFLLSKLGDSNKEAIDIVFMGIVHGNEFAGLAIMNGILEYLDNINTIMDISIAFVIGNKKAALKNKRFLQEDLNRSFAPDNKSNSVEAQRAAQIRPILARTKYLVDFHQTSQKTVEPFFVFPYSKKTLEFAQNIMPEQNILTHWSGPYSTKGMCSDHYVESCGGIGLTMETGKNGFNKKQIATGIIAGLWTINYCEYKAGNKTSYHRKNSLPAKMYTWAEEVPWPEGEYVTLNPGLYNFMHIKEGESIGINEDRDEHIIIHNDRLLLFPEYITREDAEFEKPERVCHLLKEISLQDLPNI